MSRPELPRTRIPFPKPGRATQEVTRADRRWFLLVTVVFGASVVGLAGGLALYRLTGPHPRVTLLLRRLRRIARWMIPRSRNPPKWWW